jgi:hypothetical protein
MATATTAAAHFRTKLSDALGDQSTSYFSTLNDFLCGKLARFEFDELVREFLNTSQLGMSSS